VMRELLAQRSAVEGSLVMFAIAYIVYSIPKIFRRSD
jgi:hypothetical protein